MMHKQFALVQAKPGQARNVSVCVGLLLLIAALCVDPITSDAVQLPTSSDSSGLVSEVRSSSAASNSTNVNSFVYTPTDRLARPPLSVEERERYCRFMLYRTRRVLPSYCNWKRPNCTFSVLIASLGGSGSHRAAALLQDMRLNVAHEGVSC